MPSFDEISREREILTQLQQDGRVVVGDLADQLGVSTVTVRKDLQALARRRMLRRVRGGAVPIADADEGAFALRAQRSVTAKRAIARLVAPMIGDSAVIALDSSTTCYYLARELLSRRSLVVITNGLHTAQLFMNSSNALVYLAGGVLRRSAASTTGLSAEALAGRGKIDQGFFGALGLNVQHGLMDLAVEEAQAKMAIASSCNTIYGLFDSTKAGRFGLHSFAAPDQIDGLFSDEGLPSGVVSEWEDIGVPVHVAPYTGGTEGQELDHVRGLRVGGK